MIATVTPTDIPGLVNVDLADGTEYRDLTMGQFKLLAASGGWDCRRADGTSLHDPAVAQIIKRI